ncbi:MAG TPA: alpha/beta hydrolase-fold protein [Acidobacteriaceae bacterium]|nr:alpha/beta hydrolase-fold protein [Acidobacteriaceae bacterium]
MPFVCLRRCIALLSLLFPLAVNPQVKPSCHSTVVGDLRAEHIDSKVFSGSHTLRVWLPPGYSDPANASRTYPVLYMLDGQNLFDVCTSAFGHEWQIDETLTRLIQAGSVEPLIVVGVDNAGKERADEFLPAPDSLYDPDLKPHGVDYPSFLADEIVPHIAKEYRVRTGRSNTAIGGSSYGGIAALDVLIARPMVFGLGLIESPSLQTGNGELIRATRGLLLPPARIFIGAGTDELVSNADDDRKRGVSADVINSDFVHATNMLADNFRNLDGTEMKLVITPGAHHNETAWAERFSAAAQFLFPEESGR